ncbi:MAG: ribonuclease P protein component [Curvibacter sp.]
MHLLRLTTQAQFRALLASTPVARTAHFVMHRMDLHPAPDTGGSTPVPPQPFAHSGLWLGAMVSKRWARRAVTRNLIKRQIYTLGQQHLCPGDAAYLVRLRSAYEKRQFQSAASVVLRGVVRSELEQLYRRCQPQAKSEA